MEEKITIYFFQMLKVCKNFKMIAYLLSKKTKNSMMWPSQNFLLYNGIIIKIKVNEKINK